MAALNLTLAFVLLVGATSYAQSSAVLEGRVFDPSGAVLQGATINVRSLSTAFDRSVSTDAEGRYHVAAIPAGTDVVTASAAAFRVAVLGELTINVGLTLVRDFHMKVGGHSETVVVSAPLVDVTSSEMRGNIDRRQMEQLPLSGRNWMELALQVRGITEQRREVILARQAKERARREREQAAARDRHLNRLAKRQADAWRRVEALVTARRPGDYDAAITLLKDLRDVGERKGRSVEVAARIRALRAYAKKPSLLARLRKAGL